MAARYEVYKCDHCGIITEVLVDGPGTLKCCGQKMPLLTENTTDASKEKHLPVIEKIEGGYRVIVGSVDHPMKNDHHIVWIELITEGTSYREFLKPGETPEATFDVGGANVTVREYCNLHGHWKTEA